MRTRCLGLLAGASCLACSTCLWVVLFSEAGTAPCGCTVQAVDGEQAGSPQPPSSAAGLAAAITPMDPASPRAAKDSIGSSPSHPPLPPP